jgi:hypothetical protein
MVAHTCTPVLPSTGKQQQEGRECEASLGKVNKTLSQKQTNKRAGGMVHVVELLLVHLRPLVQSQVLAKINE